MLPPEVCSNRRRFQAAVEGPSSPGTSDCPEQYTENGVCWQARTNGTIEHGLAKAMLEC